MKKTWHDIIFKWGHILSQNKGFYCKKSHGTAVGIIVVLVFIGFR